MVKLDFLQFPPQKQNKICRHAKKSFSRGGRYGIDLESGRRKREESRRAIEGRERRGHRRGGENRNDCAGVVADSQWGEWRGRDDLAETASELGGQPAGNRHRLRLVCGRGLGAFGGPCDQSRREDGGHEHLPGAVHISLDRRQKPPYNCPIIVVLKQPVKKGYLSYVTNP
jgi:hypothetical protein